MDKSQPNTLYGTTENRINTLGNVSNSADVYRVFGAVRKEKTSDDPTEIIKYMFDTYGITLTYVTSEALTGGGGWAMEFDVVDEVKYTLFLLKYTK